MLKLMGSICVLGGGLLCWLTALAERRRTRTALGDLLAALRRMREEIRMARTPLPLLLEALGSDCRGPETAALFRRSADAARQGGDWRRPGGAALVCCPCPPENERF